MPRHALSTATFPGASFEGGAGWPVEVTLIAQLAHGEGDRLHAAASARQRAHPAFIDALDEPSARLGGMHPEHGDATSMYSFAVGPAGHPFHRHAGHRVFTAVSGSGGARLCFSSASHDAIERDPTQFVRLLRYVDVPPDCLFTVRFHGSTWHRFMPRQPHGQHPALFALSCHTNELGGELDDVTHTRVSQGDASIPLLTELLPVSVQAWLDAHPTDDTDVPAMSLSLDAPAGSLHALFCRCVRGALGIWRSCIERLRRAGGYLGWHTGRLLVSHLPTVPSHALLSRQLEGVFHHEDVFTLILDVPALARRDASSLLADLLDGFLANPPGSVSRLMALRNALVRPLGLRTSPLGCPVSSLLSTTSEQRFAGRFPVRAWTADAVGRHAQVILGADDKHLRFRSCVGVRVLDDRQVELSLGSRVQCTHLLGHLYMRAIERVHRHHVSPAMLRHAATHAFALQTQAAQAPFWQIVLRD